MQLSAGVTNTVLIQNRQLSLAAPPLQPREFQRETAGAKESADLLLRFSSLPLLAWRMGNKSTKQQRYENASKTGVFALQVTALALPCLPGFLSHSRIRFRFAVSIALVCFSFPHLLQYRSTFFLSAELLLKLHCRTRRFHPFPVVLSRSESSLPISVRLSSLLSSLRVPRRSCLIPCFLAPPSLRQLNSATVTVLSTSQH